MPNQRKPGKKQVNCWPWAETVKDMDAIARAKGLTRTELAVEALEEYVKKHAQQNARRKPTKRKS